MKNRIYLQWFNERPPFYPTCKEVIYMPFSGSAILDSFFKRNLESIKALFRKELKYEFIFIPDVVKKYAEPETLKYFHPLSDVPSQERVQFVEQELINKLLHNDDGKTLAPGLIHYMQTEQLREFDGDHEGCLEFSYFPMEEDNDENLMAILRDYVKHCGEIYCHFNYSLPDMWQYSEDDRAFYSAQDRYFEQFSDKDVIGITRYIIDSLVDRDEISRIEVAENGDITLSDFGIKINMCSAVRAIYLLFLRHPEGIVFVNIRKYIEELAMICKQLELDELSMKIVAYSLDSDSDFIDQFCGEIYVKFREKLDKKAAAHYIIQAAPYDFDTNYREPYIQIGEPKKIILDRSLVSWHKNFQPQPFEYITKV